MSALQAQLHGGMQLPTGLETMEMVKRMQEEGSLRKLEQTPIRPTQGGQPTSMGRYTDSRLPSLFEQLATAEKQAT